MEARQLEILCSLFRTAWPEEGATAEQLRRLESWMQSQDVLLTERVALTEACLGHADPRGQLADEQSREDAMELLVSLEADPELVEALAAALAIAPDELELLRQRALRDA
jgi:hypothetical protein